MELNLNLDYTFVDYNDKDFTKKKGKELRDNNNTLSNNNIDDDNDVLYIKQPRLRINDVEGFYKEDTNAEILVPSLEFAVFYRQDELYSFVVQAEKIIMLRDMLDSYLKAFEMREKILGQ